MSETVKARCNKAELVFDKETGLALYLDFDIIEVNQSFGTTFYVTSLVEINSIMQIINEEKTGLAKDCFNNEDLKRLIGKEALLLSTGKQDKFFFMGWT